MARKPTVHRIPARRRRLHLDPYFFASRIASRHPNRSHPTRGSRVELGITMEEVLEDLHYGR